MLILWLYPHFDEMSAHIFICKSIDMYKKKNLFTFIFFFLSKESKHVDSLWKILMKGWRQMENSKK